MGPTFQSGLRVRAFRLLIEVVLAAVSLLTGRFCAQAQYAFQMVDHPLSDPSNGGTAIMGIDNTTMVGNYTDSNSVTHGFVYDGVTWKTLDHPSGTNGTFLTGISGTNIIGYYADQSVYFHGFVYGGTNFTAIEPLAIESTANGIQSNNIVGYYATHTVPAHGFLYDGSNYTTLDFPNTNIYATYAQGIWGGEIVGYYDIRDPTTQMDSLHGFIYTNNVWTTLDAPLAKKSTYLVTLVTGVSGVGVTGYYTATNFTVHGFLFDGSKFTVLDVPSALETQVWGISGSSLVGTFLDSVGWHGFLATLPTPPRLSITNAGGLVKISWPYPSTGWSLQQNANLGTTNWNPSVGIANDGTNNFLNIPSPTGVTFFRLIQ